MIKENNVQPAEVKAIVEGGDKWKVLVLLDEYDVYNMTNMFTTMSHRKTQSETSTKPSQRSTWRSAGQL